MTTAAIELYWSVAEAGYVWQAPPMHAVDIHDRGTYRSVLKPADGACLFRLYQPLSDFTGLFRTFAAINPGPRGEGIIAFANRFGPLGSPPPGFRLDAPTMNLPERPDTWDLLGIWILAIWEMSELVSVWDLIKLG